jgi:hypothetical protein
MIRNSCGVRLHCGYCSENEECNADSNQCEPCAEPTCADLGVECGSAWNGCGNPSQENNQLNCADCAGDMICNDNYNICERDCTPGAAEDICFQAFADQGVECGWISDGCGGLVNCGDTCPPGEACGVRGVANRCAKPERQLECEVAGRECGTWDSTCEGTINCGTCPPEKVCRANGTCGAPCVPRTCETAFAGKCGQQLDDGCNGFINCGCAPGLGCTATVPGITGTCRPLSTCADYTTGENGQICSTGPSYVFPRGDGVNLTCNCTGGRLCVDTDGNLVTGTATGTCCTNTSTCNGTSCTATNSCTGQTTLCCNPATQYCHTPTDTCVNRLTCNQIEYNSQTPDGAAGAPCSNGAAFNDGSGTLITCPCTGGRVCVDGNGNLVTGSTIGTCCANTNTCQNTPLNNSCQITNSCTGAPINCCTSSQCCEPGSPNQCVAANTCSTYTNAQAGSACSTNNFFSRCSATSPDTSLL